MKVSSTAEGPALQHPWKKTIAVGRGYELLRKDLQEHLLFLQKTFHYQHIRFHASFHDDVNVVQQLPDGEIVYRWTQLDHIYDFLVESGFDPIVEINPMPKALASGDKAFFWYRMNITPPQSYDAWSDFIKAVTAHFVERYGIKRVRNWYFEVWNEPNLRDSFWDGTMEEYFALYRASAEAVKAVDPELRVGGPAGSGADWNLPLAHYCRDNGVPLDFISYHNYPVWEADLDVPPGMFFVGSLQKAKRQLAEAGFGHLPILITEWNTLTQDADKKINWVGNDSVNNLLAGAAVCHFAHTCDDLAEQMAWWVASDVFEEGGPEVEPYGNRYQYYGMLTIDGVPKSSFHAFRFLARLLGKRYEIKDLEREAPTQNVIITDEKVATRALAWNLVFPFEVQRGWRFKLELPVPESMKAQKEVRLSAAWVRAGQGSAYEYWQQMGAPANLTLMEQETLSMRAMPDCQSRMVPVENGSVSVAVMLQPNEFVFFEVGGDKAGSGRIAGEAQDVLNEALKTDVPAS